MILVWILAPVVVVVALLAIGAYRNRKPSSLEAGLKEFRRGLEALDPANDPLKRTKADARANKSDKRARR
jgi:hypothetical protein